MMFSGVLRNLCDAGNLVRIALASGVVLDAMIESVGEDYLKTETGQYIPFLAIDVLQDGVDDGDDFDPSDPQCQKCPGRESCEGERQTWLD